MCDESSCNVFFAALHGNVGSYLRDTLQEGSADAVAGLPVPRAYVFPSFLLFARLLFSFKAEISDR
jgi:hypothetical protein